MGLIAVALFAASRTLAEEWPDLVGSPDSAGSAGVELVATPVLSRPDLPVLPPPPPLSVPLFDRNNLKAFLMLNLCLPPALLLLFES